MINKMTNIVYNYTLYCRIVNNISAAMRNFLHMEEKKSKNDKINDY